MRVLICGGGVIGASIAYFLSCRGVEAIVVERTGIACAASGKSGGFLALDWCDGTPLEALARRSFALHASLADRIGNDWGYRRLTTYGGSASAGDGRPRRNAHGVNWLSDGVAVDHRLGSTATTAQVHPGQFTAAMMRAAEVQGAELRLGRVTGLVRDAARVKGVEIDGGIIEGDAVVIAMGPWSILAAGWLPLPPVLGLKGHSLVFETGTKVPAEALFLEYQEAGGGVHSPERWVPCPSGVAPMGADRSKKERPSLAGGSRVARGWASSTSTIYGSHAAGRMGARKGARCELRNIPSLDKASITRQHMPSIGRQSPGHAFGRAGAAVVIG